MSIARMGLFAVLGVALVLAGCESEPAPPPEPPPPAPAVSPALREGLLEMVAQPYSYTLLEQEDISYAAAKRMVYRIYLDTTEVPDIDRMKGTAAQVWRSGNRKWNEFTVFMIFGPIKDFSAGAYGIAEFNPSGLTDFRINKVALQMVKLRPTTRSKTPAPQSQSEALAKPNPDQLESGETYIVSQQTPLMPEFDPEDPLGAIRRMKQIPKGGMFTIYEVRVEGSYPWYQVLARGPNKEKIGVGWINSVALFGQDLKPYE